MRSASALLSRPTPARPGPGPMAEGLLRALDVTIGRRVEGLLAGDFRSNAARHRHRAGDDPAVRAGDDVRRIDWNVTARTGEPHVRVDLAERVLVTWLVLDTSASMQFGTADRRKADVAEGVAIAIGHLATRRGNRLGVVTFGGARALALPPRQGRAGLVGLLAALQGRAGERGRRGVDTRSALRSRAPARSRASARSSWSSPTSAARATGDGRCSSSRATTTSSRSRSATRASRSCRTSACSGSSIRRPGGSCAWTRAAAGCASGSPSRLRPSAARSRACSRRPASGTSC